MLAQLLYFYAGCLYLSRQTYEQPLENIQNILKNIYKRGISTILVEGGAKTLNSFIEHNLWDEARVFTSSKKLENGISAPIINKSVSYSKNIQGDNLDFYFN